MSQESIIVAAALWDQEAVARAAVEWAESGQGAALLRLKPSQFGALSRSVKGAGSAEDLLDKLKKFLRDQTARKKRRAVWHQLLEALPPALEKAAAAACESPQRGAESFKNCCRLLERAGRAEKIPGLERERELAAMRAFFGALARRYRGQKYYGESS